MDKFLTEPKRIRIFRLELAKEIPKFPNNSASLRLLQQKSLGSLFIAYFNWRMRYVAPRSRSVIIDPLVATDANWNNKQETIVPFLDKVRRGDDLTPNLSLQPHTRGFTPASGNPGATVANRWADKDMLLNVMGYHHFHPSSQIEATGFSTRSNDIVFAHVTRETFSVVGIFDHSVFDTLPDGTITKERRRLFELFDALHARGVPAGSVVLDGLGITTSGHALPVIAMAQNYARLVAQIDPHIDDPVFQTDFFKQAGINVPKKPKWKWSLNHLDLALYEATSSTFGFLRRGMN